MLVVSLSHRYKKKRGCLCLLLVPLLRLWHALPSKRATPEPHADMPITSRKHPYINTGANRECLVWHTPWTFTVALLLMGLKLPDFKSQKQSVQVNAFPIYMSSPPKTVLSDRTHRRGDAAKISNLIDIKEKKQRFYIPTAFFCIIKCSRLREGAQRAASAIPARCDRQYSPLPEKGVSGENDGIEIWLSYTICEKVYIK